MYRATQTADPYLKPSFSLPNRVRRQAWSVCCALLFRTSPRPFHSWRAFLLRCFGAQLGPSCHFYPKARIWAPWNLVCADGVSLGDEAEIYNPCLLYTSTPAKINRKPTALDGTHALSTLAAITLKGSRWVFAEASEPFTVSQAPCRSKAYHDASVLRCYLIDPVPCALIVFAVLSAHSGVSLLDRHGCFDYPEVALAGSCCEPSVQS